MEREEAVAIVEPYATFLQILHEVFGQPVTPITVQEELLQLHQGKLPIHEYILRFRTLSLTSGWNDSALLAVFRRGLNANIRQQMAIYEDNVGLDAFLKRAVTISQHLTACETPVEFAPSCTSTEEPMHTDTYHLTAQERTRRLQGGLCLYCGAPSHLLLQCPVRPAKSTRKVISCYSTTIESPEVQLEILIPPEYAEFQDVFSKTAATQLPPHRRWDCAIDLVPHVTLPKGKVYPLSLPERRAMDEYVAEALVQGFIQPSTSPAASSFFFVAKKDGGLRPCIDYRALNEQTVKFCISPSARSIHLRGITTSQDFYGDEWKTAFVTPSGHYEYRVMPYGLANSPSIFQNFMNEIFRDMLHQFVVVYIDDILIYSNDLSSHISHVKQVLQRLRKYQLYLKGEKCEFHQDRVQFLGYYISPEGIEMDPKKVAAVQDWPTPTTVKELQRFLGFANFYRRFIKGYSQITSVLTSLLKGAKKTITWTSAAQTVFTQLKSAFCTAPVLKHPDPNSPFIVEVDALPPAKLSSAEQNYDVGNRELLAIKLALEEWRHWLEGAQFPFTVITDHKNLQYLQGAKRVNPRQARWALFFTRFDFHISYRPGTKNTKADALSRLHQPDPISDEPETILPQSVFLAPIQWSWDDQIQEATRHEPAPPGGPEGKQYIPSSLRHCLLDSVHTSPGSGHPGGKRTLSLLRNHYWWPQMTRDVYRYIRGCVVCAINNTSRRLPEGKLVPLSIPQRPWSHIGIDFATDLPKSDGFTTILVVVDRFSKACKLIPLPGLPTAMNTAQLLFSQIFRHFGIPEDIVSDRGTQFTSRVWREFFRLLGVSISLSSGYHPETNGQTERKIQEICRYLRSYCHNHQESWNQYLPWAEYAQNSLRQETTGLTPFQCVLGYQPPLFPWNDEPSSVPAVDYWFRESERPGELVWLSTRDINLRLPCRKLSPKFIGPFPIIRRLNDVTYELQLPPHYRIAPTFHVSLLKRHFNPTFPPSADHPEPPPQPEIETTETIYRVQEILDSRRWNGRLQYLIEWEGYGPEERSWIDRDDILDPSLTAEFHQSHPTCPAPRGRGCPRRRVRASGDARGGGGNVTPSHSPDPGPVSTERTQSPTPDSAPITRSQSPDY
ncbi:hypothetical protein M9458_056230 [Cirrhinus mrigala]|uniref:Gypsy retrotransposon integrase-like protein 1 n=1 Tax=Cirrhinus mrigala TaxID=683832 RepID=A0ABD0MFK8_CIRMR